ncbi:hypothetical protein BCU54_016080 [Vibrio lentus]|nr:hypothetical protein [Vibrio lentus]PMH96834.1 hypothetical protein BCU54_10400 [Vibrio lentus]
MFDNKYIKHPHNCEKCKRLTPHVPVQKSEDSALEVKQSSFHILFEYLTTLLFKGDSHAGSFHLDHEEEFKCEKCGTRSWH